jgi:trimethylamine:corrinoid methyltransferase-like protein
MLESYEQPPLDEAIEQELVEFVESRAAELGDPVDVRTSGREGR